MVNRSELKDFLDEKALQYNRPNFIQSDPIQVPHRFEKKEDIEIMGFLSAIIAWGQRKSIISNAFKLAEIFEYEPFRFVIDYQPFENEAIRRFVHRTFQGHDLDYFIRALQAIYLYHGGLEKAFSLGISQKERICRFGKLFLSFNPPERTKKHIANPDKGSAAKRINMFLRWMVRPAIGGVDFGLWHSIPLSQLMIPLDVHTGNVGRELGLLKRKQNDWKAVEELSANLRSLDPNDPIKYDLALFGLGAFEGFGKTIKR